MAHPVGATPYAARRRRPRWVRFVFLALLLVPIIEIAAIVAVGKVIGGWPTFGLLVLESLLGAWLVRREGRRTWVALNQALHTGAMPSRELADAALVLIGGTLLLTPGFVTDVFGFLFILPMTRPLTRGFLEKAVRARMLATAAPMPGWPGSAGTSGSPRSAASGQTVEGSIVDRP